MAGLYKRPGSPFWWLCYREGGKAFRTSTGVKHNDAKNPPKMGTAAEIMRETEDRLARQKFGLVVNPKDMAIEDWMADYFTLWKEAKGPAASTLYSIEYNSNPFRKWAQAEGYTRMSSITPQVMAAYFRARKDVSDKTRKNEASFWAQVWDRAKKANVIRFEENAWRDFIPERVTQKDPPRPFTPAEIEILLRDSEGWMRFAIHVGYYTGERFTAILELKVADVDFKQNVIRFTETKQAKKAKASAPRIRFLYMVPPLAEFLKGWRAAGATWLDPDLIAKNRAGRTVNHSMSDFVGRLRVLHKGLFQGASFHSLRHTFATMLNNAGISQAQRMEILDHSTIGAHQGYVHAQAAKAIAHADVLKSAFTLHAHSES